MIDHTRSDLNEIPEAGLVLLARHPAPNGNGTTVGAQPAGQHICLPKYWRPDRGEVCWCGAAVGRQVGAEVIVLAEHRRNA